MIKLCLVLVTASMEQSGQIAVASPSPVHTRSKTRPENLIELEECIKKLEGELKKRNEEVECLRLENEELRQQKDEPTLQQSLETPPRKRVSNLWYRLYRSVFRGRQLPLTASLKSGRES